MACLPVKHYQKGPPGPLAEGGPSAQSLTGTLIHHHTTEEMGKRDHAHKHVVICQANVKSELPAHLVGATLQVHGVLQSKIYGRRSRESLQRSGHLGTSQLI